MFYKYIISKYITINGNKFVFTSGKNVIVNHNCKFYNYKYNIINYKCETIYGNIII